MEIDTVTRLQIKALRISYDTNTLGKGMNPTVSGYDQILGQTGLFNLVIATDLD